MNKNLSFKKFNKVIIDDTLINQPVIISATFENCIINSNAKFNRCIFKNCTFQKAANTIGCIVIEEDSQNCEV